MVCGLGCVWGPSPSGRRPRDLTPCAPAGVDLDQSRREEEQCLLQDARQWLNSGKIQDTRQPRSGATALHVAAAKGYSEVLRYVISMERSREMGEAAWALGRREQGPRALRGLLSDHQPFYLCWCSSTNRPLLLSRLLTDT